jgi:4-hydroxythreonine-4-phosphate dehydrogenase
LSGTNTALLALTLGDPSGIGPEVSLAALREESVTRAARIIVIGPASLRPASIPGIEWSGAANLHEELPDGGQVWLSSAAPAAWDMGRAQESAGRAALAALHLGHRLALAGFVDALVTAPVCKQALRLAGENIEGQTELLGRWCDVTDHQMLAIAGDLRVLLLSRHLPLADALALVSGPRVLRHLEILHAGLRALGFEHPRLALAGLNPHAGEAGTLGHEEHEVLEPALRKARALGLDVHGPVSADVVFAQAAGGAFDGVLALYHDQAFIPVKLLGRDRGLTVILGLPYLRLSPAHGTAFDIAGQGIARHEGLQHALLEAARMVAARGMIPVATLQGE